MSKQYVKTKVFNIGRSTLLIKWLAILHAGALFSAIDNSLIFTYKVLLVFLILTSLIFYIKQTKDFSPFSLMMSTDYGWGLRYSDNNFQAINIMPSSVLTPYLIVLHFKTQNNQKKTILIFKDALDVDKYRQLLVELKVTGLAKENQWTDL